MTGRGELVKTSFLPEDVTVLLKDLTGRLTPLDERERELLIQSGRHYSELLPTEYQPSDEYLRLYREALDNHTGETARAVVRLGELVWRRREGRAVLVSLARAGTPVGVLVKRYLERRYHCPVPHYSISIIRDRGIDENAMRYILARHPAGEIQFLDGWVGKGTIAGELKKYTRQYAGIDSELAVLADPAGITTVRGTREDFLIPSACLNAPVSGLFSRTILHNRLISDGDFHGAVYYRQLEKIDQTYPFINRIDRAVSLLEEADMPAPAQEQRGTAAGELDRIAKAFGISNRNFIKPGIGETTRVLMRRVPEAVLVSDPADTRCIGHILRLCGEKGVAVREYPLLHYKACGLIRKMTDV